MVYYRAIPMNHNTEIIMKQDTLGWLNGLVGVAILSYAEETVQLNLVN